MGKPEGPFVCACCGSRRQPGEDFSCECWEMGSNNFYMDDQGEVICERHRAMKWLASAKKPSLLARLRGWLQPVEP